MADDAAAGAAERERRADDERQPDVGQRCLRLGDRVRDRTARHPQSGGGHRVTEPLAVLGAVDRVVVGADQLDPEPLQRPVFVQRLCQVERGLAAERRQQRVGPLALDHLGDRTWQQRLDVGRRRDLRVGHDRRRVGVDEHDLVALLYQHAACLGAGVVELGRLADHDRARPEQQDLVDVVTPRHGSPRRSGRTGIGRRAARDRLLGGTGPLRPGRRAAADPRPCGRRG